MRRGALRAAVLVLGALVLAPASAWGHASLLETSPGRGEQLQTAPRELTLRFSEPVEASFGAVRVFDARGATVETRTRTSGRTVVAELPPGLGEGGYTATYRVISADSHPVSSGFVFSVGEGGAAPAATVDELLDRQREAGAVTTAALGAARAVQYGALALGIGTLLFLLACWVPAVRESAGAGPEWARATAAFGRRTRGLLLAAAGLGVVSGALGVALQGAVAGATSLWSALDATTIGEVLGTRFGTAWGLGVLAWAAVGGTALLAGARMPVLRPASLGATGLALPTDLRVAVVAFPLALLALLPALGGHAAAQSPQWLLVPANVLHVLAISAWVGGVAVLVVALRAATAGLAADERTRLLVAAVGRFSTLAGIAVAVVLLSGVVQSLVSVASWGALLDTAYGRSVLVKLVLFTALIGLGAANRARVLPALRRAAGAGASPGGAGVLLRRLLRVEVAIFVVALGVTGALATYAPSTAASGGPFSDTVVLGPARMEATVEPARVGLNEMHLYLFDRADGRQFDATKELTITAELPAKGIAPIELEPSRAGPGHFVVGGAALTVPGDWTVSVTSRVSDFDQYEARLKVPIR